MQIVPKNKTFCIGARKFVEGDVIPPYIKVEIPEMTRQEAMEEAKEIEKPKRQYRKRSTKGVF